MKMNVPTINFIKHFLEMNELFRRDMRLSPFHISLYNSLFLEWNHCGFQNPISISRNELMSMSKIGSINSYTKTLKELSQFGYLEYKPSFNRFIGSKIIMYTFSKGCDKGCDKGCSKGCDKALVMPLIPYINYNKLNKTKQTNKTIDEKTNLEKNKVLLFPKTEIDVTKKQTHSFPSTLEEVQVYFSEKKFKNEEAEKFYNYFESNGWLVGGKTKMKNWKAAANNWIINSVKFQQNNSNQPKANHLQVNQDKDYSIPL
jgi:hypothetical protein